MQANPHTFYSSRPAFCDDDLRSFSVSIVACLMLVIRLRTDGCRHRTGCVRVRRGVAARPLPSSHVALVQLAIERGEAHAEPAGGESLVTAAAGQDAANVAPLVAAEGVAEVLDLGDLAGRGDQVGGEVGRGQDRAVAEDDGTLQGVVELADVPPPGGGE